MILTLSGTIYHFLDILVNMEGKIMSIKEEHC